MAKLYKYTHNRARFLSSVDECQQMNIFLPIFIGTVQWLSLLFIFYPTQ